MSRSISLSVTELSKEAILSSDSSYNGDEVSVIVDGNEGQYNFGYMYEGSWITVDNSMNPVKIYVSDNDGEGERETYVNFYHKADETVSATLIITQAGDERTITVGDTSDLVNFNPLVSSSKTLGISVGGGRKRFYIKGILKYDADGIRLDNDNAFSFSTQQDSDGEYTMTISTDGNISTEMGQYYYLVLSHMDKKSMSEKIKLTFAETDTMFDIPTLPIYNTSTASKENEISTVSLMSDNVEENEDIMTLSVDEEETVDITEKIYAVVNSVTNPDEINITDGAVSIRIYTVVNNNGVAETDSAISYKLSAAWAKVSLDKDNTNLEYKTLIVTPTKTNTNIYDRKLRLTVTNLEKNTQVLKLVIVQDKVNR